MSTAHCSVYAQDVKIRHNANFSDNSLNYAHTHVRNVFDQLRLNRPEFGTSFYVPVLEASLHGFKRYLDDDSSMAPGDGDEVRDLEDLLPEE